MNCVYSLTAILCVHNVQSPSQIFIFDIKDYAGLLVIFTRVGAR